MFDCIARFNLQGAGTTSISPTSNLKPAGICETLDVTRHVLQQLGPGPKRLYIIGYSYGACIAAHVMAHVPEVRRVQGSLFHLVVSMTSLRCGGYGNSAMGCLESKAGVSDEVLMEFLMKF
jgi:alpha/beta superfamily hydrolase